MHEVPLVTSLCECEHESHFDGSLKSPNGNPNHPSNQRYNIALMVDKITPFGTFKVCSGCACDCYQDFPTKGKGV